jgi:hypothetical protein
LSDQIAAALDAEAAAEVVRDHHAKAGEQRVLEVVGEIDQGRAGGARVRPTADRQPVVHVAIQDELAGGAAFVGKRELAGPGRSVGRSRHLLLSGSRL